MKLQPDAKLLLRSQIIGMVSIVLFLIVGIFGYFLFKDSLSYNNRLSTLKKEINQQQKLQIRSEINAAKSYIRYMSDSAESVLKEQSRMVVEEAHTIASAIFSEQKEKLPEIDVKNLIRESLRNVRFFNGRGYFFINELTGRNVLLPIKTELEGKDLYNYQDDNGAYTTRRILASVDNTDGAGYSRYRWVSPDINNRDVQQDKISYAKKFVPYNWLIGTGDYLYSFQNDLRKAALDRLSRIRFGKHGYISILDKSGRVLLSPNHSSPIQINDLQDPKEKALFNRLLDFANSGGGFINYEWGKEDSLSASSKISLVENLEEFNWVIIADTYSEDLDAIFTRQRLSLETRAKQDIILLLIALVTTGLITLTMILMFTRWYKSIFHRYQANIDQQRGVLEANAQQLQIAARVFETANEGILVTDPDKKIIAINPACYETTGYSESEMLGGNPSMLASGVQGAEFYREMWKQIDETGSWKGELWNRRKNGEVYPEWLAISTSRDLAGNVINYIATFSDVSERKDAEKRLRYLAEYDPLTELANRRLLTDRAEEAINLCRSNNNQELALMFIDLDRFKNINDSLGHAIGDQVLQSTAKRLLSTVRNSDTVCRLGGDEFIILVNHPKAAAASARLANRILKELADPLQIDSLDLMDTLDLVVTPSIGIAIYPENGDNFDTLLKNADAALYHAKSQGRNNFQFFTRDMNTKASEKLSIERGLREALQKEQFEVYYQAQFDLISGELCGCEALLRWNCPNRGYVSPEVFIPIAEETGMILPIGQWVLEQACRQGVAWSRQGLPATTIAVNVSSYQFNKHIVDIIKNSLLKTGLPPKLLSIELTESALMKDPEFTKEALLKLRSTGIHIALDDFGTGYSSLAYLKRFPIDKLKIDRTFIDGLPHDQDDLAITQSIIDVARNLNMTTIAEGVETPQQKQFLFDAGCNQMQGFLKAKPMAAPEFSTHFLMEPIEEPAQLV